VDKPIVPHQIRKIFDGRIFSVSVERITLPGGGLLEVEIVRHPGSVVVIPMRGSHEILLVRQYRHALGRRVWELPAGSLEPGEDPRAAAARECQEEVGLVASTLQPMGTFFPTPGYCDEEMHVFVADGLRPPAPGDADVRPDPDEEIEVRAFPIVELRQMIRAGEIIDLKTVAGLALLEAETSRY
jgi:ADP-ribose pyrophosphatase